MKTKVCSKCGIEKSLNEFSTDNQRKDGLYPQCRLCRKLYQQENKEKRKQYRKVYNQKNKHIHALYIQNYRKNIMEFLNIFTDKMNACRPEFFEFFAIISII